MSKSKTSQNNLNHAVILIMIAWKQNCKIWSNMDAIKCKILEYIVMKSMTIWEMQQMNGMDQWEINGTTHHQITMTTD